MAAAGVPYPVLGTMTFGIEGQVKPDVAAVQVKSFCASACTASPAGVLIDTARIYQVATPHGDTETVLGQIFADPDVKAKVSVATKANPAMEPHKSLSRESVIEQCNVSLAKLGLDSIPLYYLHFPDIHVDLDETLSAIDQLHKEGKIKEFGLSNYAAWQVVDIWHRCKSRGMVLPTVYQGMYNVITRDMEREIVPVSREFGIRLYMYNPMAGGLLSGRYTKVEDLAAATEGRFSAEFDHAFGSHLKAGKLYQARYSKDAIFEGLSILRKASEDSGISMPDIALRWIVHHSFLRGGDGVIIGVSKPQHLDANLSAWSAGPLPETVVEACNLAWQASRPACEAYFRGYGAVPGAIEGFLAVKRRKEEAESESKKPKV